jgi:very-short-patch-repair endonuclease
LRGHKRSSVPNLGCPSTHFEGCESDRSLFALAAQQLGCVTIEQAVRCGLTRDQLRHRIERGRLERLGPRVLRVAGSPPAWEQMLMAGLLDLGREAVVSYRAAASLHGFDRFAPGPLEFTVERARHGLRSPWTVHTTRTLGLVDRTTVGPFACTTASRTVIDLARSGHRDELERAIDSAVRDGYSSPTFLRKRLAALRGPGRWGVRLLDELLVDAGGHSKLERAFLKLVRSAGLPRPTCQRIYKRDGQTIARVDFDFEPRPVVAEVSGRLGHVSDAERAKDARRRNELYAFGRYVLEFTYDDVFRQPEYVVRTLRHHLT